MTIGDDHLTAGGVYLAMERLKGRLYLGPGVGGRDYSGDRWGG